MVRHSVSPVGIGGIGGSGTRVLARLIQMLGYYLGDDLNDALDNLWFTLLFKRRSVLVETGLDFRRLVDLFVSRMSGKATVAEPERARLWQLADQDRFDLPRDWLKARANSFLNGGSSRRPGQPWGWKEPNTHVLADRLFEVLPNFHYIHLFRDPFHMATSNNQNQPRLWGPVFLDRDIAITPRSSLSYWCASHRRIIAVMNRWPARAIKVEYHALCAGPDAHLDRIAEFLGASVPMAARSAFRDFVRPVPGPEQRHGIDLDQFDPGDLAYVRSAGYSN